MSKIYDALNELVSNPFDPQNAALGTRVACSTSTLIGHELVELEKLFVDRIGRLRAAADQAEIAVASESQRTAQTIETLNGEISALNARLKETMAIIERKDIANRIIERDLTKRIDELQIELRKQEEVLASRESEVKALKSEVNRLKDGIQVMVSAVSQHAQALARNPAENLNPVTVAEAVKTGANSSVSSQVWAPAIPSLEPSSDSNIVPSTFER